MEICGSRLETVLTEKKSSNGKKLGLNCAKRSAWLRSKLVYSLSND